MLRRKRRGMNAFQSRCGCDVWRHEADVAVSLYKLRHGREFLTVLPQNDIANACIRELRYFE